GRYQRMTDSYRPNLPLGNLDHVIVRVSDLASEVAFWRDVIGLGCIKASAKWAEFRFGDRVLALQAQDETLVYSSRNRTHGPAPLTQPTFALSLSVSDLSVAIARLSANNIAITAPPREICSNDGSSYLYA